MTHTGALLFFASKRRQVNDMKQWWINFLEKLAKANEKEFGGKAMDCCGLNAQKPVRPAK